MIVIISDRTKGGFLFGYEQGFGPAKISTS
jgi:hypothetical protein